MDPTRSQFRDPSLSKRKIINSNGNSTSSNNNRQARPTQAKRRATVRAIIPSKLTRNRVRGRYSNNNGNGRTNNNNNNSNNNNQRNKSNRRVASIPNSKRSRTVISVFKPLESESTTEYSTDHSITRNM